jgi:hypothetical protein
MKVKKVRGARYKVRYRGVYTRWVKVGYDATAKVGRHRINLCVMANTVFVEVDGQFDAINEPNLLVRTKIALKAMSLWKGFLKEAEAGDYYCVPARAELRELYLRMGWQPVGDKLCYHHKPQG